MVVIAVMLLAHCLMKAGQRTARAGAVGQDQEKEKKKFAEAKGVVCFPRLLIRA